MLIRPEVATPIRVLQLYLISAGASKPSIKDARIVFRPPGRADLEPYAIDFPFNWDVDPYHDNNWCGQLHMWRMVDPYLIQFERSEDPRWLALPIAVMLDWLRHETGGKRKSKMAWLDMAMGLRAMKIAFVLSWWQAGRLQLADATVQALQELVRLHAKYLLDEELVHYSNHTFADLQGLMALAQVADADIRSRAHAFVGKVLPRLLSLQFDSHGVHLENSVGYQPFGLNCLKRLRYSKWFEQFRVDELIAKGEAAQQWFYLPDGRFAPIGDTDGAPPRTEVTKPVFEGRRQLFDSSGYVVVRDDGGGSVDRSSYLFFMGAFNSHYHKQLDDLSVVWFEGEDILVDAGKYAYKKSPYRWYTRSARAHNSVEVDDVDARDLTDHSPVPSGSAIRQAQAHDWGFLVRGAIKHELFDAWHHRACLYQPGSWLLVFDQLSAPESHDYTQWFHFAPHIADLDQEGDAYTTALSGKRLVMRTVTTRPAERVWIKGAMTPRVQGWVSRGYRQIEPNLALGIRQAGAEAAFATLFTIDDRGSTLALEPGNRLSLSIRCKGTEERFRVLPGEDAGAVRVLAGRECDADPE